MGFAALNPYYAPVTSNRGLPAHAPTMSKRVTYQVISYGEWTRPRMRNFREQCCDCGLIHRLDFRIVHGRIEFRTRRDDRATAAARRTFKFTPEE
jgi:hypothetical protein